LSLKTPLLVSLFIVAFMLALSAWAWAELPADSLVPVHWGISGQADRYGGKAEALVTTPVVAVALTLLLWGLPRVEPRQQNLRASAAAYRAIWIALMLFMAAIHAAIVLTALGVGIPMFGVFSVGLGLLFIVIGSQVGKTRSTYLMGVRTPWTLSSDRSWERTHRLAARLFVALGVLLVIVAFTGEQVLLVGVPIGGLAVILGVLFVTSYFEWKGDPNRQA
jgi:uncharacterized membrane protein